MKNNQFMSLLVCLGFLYASAGDYNVVAQYCSGKKSQGAFAIDISADHQYLVATGAEHSIQQYQLVDGQDINEKVVKIAPYYTYEFPSKRNRSEFFIKYGSGDIKNMFYAHGSEGAWFENGVSTPLGTTKGINSEVIALLESNSFRENSKILVGLDVPSESKSPAVMLRTFAGSVLRSYLLENKNNISQVISALVVSADKKTLAAGISGTILACLWDLETGKPIHTVENDQDENQLCGGIVQIPDKNDYFFGSLERLVRYDAVANRLETLYVCDKDVISSPSFLDENTLVTGSDSGAVRIFDVRNATVPTAVFTADPNINAVCIVSPDSFLTSSDSGAITQWKKTIANQAKPYECSVS